MFIPLSLVKEHQLKAIHNADQSLESEKRRIVPSHGIASVSKQS